jgi:hypothetical protein
MPPCEVEATEGEIAGIAGHLIANMKFILADLSFTRRQPLTRQGIAKLNDRWLRGEQKRES